MGVRYRGEFNSYGGTAYKVDILDTAYSSSVNEFKAASPGVIIRYDGSERFDPIHSSTAKIYFTIRNATDRGFIESIIAASAYRFSVNIYQKSTELYWRGVIDTAEIVEQDKTYSVVELTAHDGIRFLKTQYQTAYAGLGVEHTYETFLDRVSECLNVLPNVADWGAGDAFIETVVDWFEANHPNTSVDPLAQTRFYSKIFTEYENSAGVKEIGLNYYDQLVEILKGWGARMFMEDGMWKIHSVQAFRGSTKNYFRYTKSGSSESTGTYSAAAQTLTHPDNGGSDFYRTAGATIQYEPRLDQVKNLYKHKGSNNLLPPHEDYLGDAWYITNKPIAATDSLKWRVKVSGYVRITNRYAATDWGGLKRSMKLRLRAYSDGFPSSVYLKKTLLGSTTSWNSSPNDYSFATRAFNTADLLAGYQSIAPVSFEIETPVLPTLWLSGSNLTNLTFRFYHGEWANSANQTPASEPTTSEIDWDLDPYDGAYANTVVVQWRAADCSVVQYDANESPIEETLYTADDGGGYSGTSEYSEVVELETIFGEPKGNAISGIQVYDGANWVDSSGGWGVDTVAGSNAFGELLALERINGRYLPLVIWNVTLKDTDLPFWKRYLLDSDVPGYFQIVGGEYNLNEDTFRGEIHRIQRDTGATASAIDYYGFDTQIDVTPPVDFDPTGLTAAIDLTDQMINNGDTVTSIDIGGDVGAGDLPAGTTFLVVNPVTGAKQTFVTSANVAEGATSISVLSTTATADFPTGSYIVIPPQDIARASRGMNMGVISCGDSSADYNWRNMVATYPKGMIPLIQGGDSRSTDTEIIYGGKSA